MHSHFIKATEAFCTAEHPVPAPLLRRSFFMEGAVKNASLSICGLGFYTLRINGTDITKGHIAPYVSNPDHLCYYDTYDVTALLREGENVVGITLGNGFQNCFGGAVWDFETAAFRGAPRVALAFSAETEMGSVTWEADSLVRTHPSPILLDDLRLGETYDARQELPGWDLPGFDDSDWSPALPAETPRGELTRCQAEPITVLEERKPVSITKQGDAYLYDFGINSAGVCRLSIRATQGQTVTLWHGEVCKDGLFYNRNLCFSLEKYPYYADYNQTVRYIASGEGVETYTPSFSYYGFRYVLVEGITEEQATEDLLTYLVMSSDLKTVGGFTCSSERVNRLYQMAVNADRSNFFYFPTDCPHREKNGWTGDASMSADHMVLMYDVEASWETWLANIRKAQNHAGALPGIVPTTGWGFRWGNGPAWDSVLFNLPYMLYRHRGNTRVIRDNAHAMLRYLSYAMTRRSEDGTIAIGLGDWVPVGKAHASHYDAPLALTDTVMVMDMARKAAEMFRAIGSDHEAAFADGIFAELRQTIRRELIDLNTMTVAGHCQSSQCISLYYGVFDPAEEPQAFARLMEYIREKSNTYDCGFLGMHCLFHVLTRFGETELAYRMITGSEYPSYGFCMDQGVTAMVEKIMPDLLDAGSHNHHFLCDYARWFTTALAGLTVIDSHTVKIAPSFVDDLTFAEAWYELPDGKVTVSWQRDANGTPRVSVTAPDSITVL